MPLPLQELTEYYLSLKILPHTKEDKQTILNGYREYLDQQYYSDLSEDKLRAVIRKYDTTSDTGKEINCIQNDIVSFIKTSNSADKKRELLAVILDFWCRLNDNGKIVINPVKGLMDLGDGSIKSILNRFIPESDELRRIELIKLIQDFKHPISKEELSDLFFVSVRTIEQDMEFINYNRGIWRYVRFNQLRSWDNQLGFWDYEGRSTRAYNSSFSLHPFFTVLPLDALVGLWKGIEDLKEQEHPHILAFEWLQQQITQQLTPYALERMERQELHIPKDIQPVYIGEMEYNGNTIRRPLEHSFKAGDEVEIDWSVNSKKCTERGKVTRFPTKDTVILETQDADCVEIVIQNINEVRVHYPRRTGVYRTNRNNR